MGVSYKGSTMVFGAIGWGSNPYTPATLKRKENGMFGYKLVKEEKIKRVHFRLTDYESDKEAAANLDMLFEDGAISKAEYLRHRKRLSKIRYVGRPVRRTSNFDFFLNFLYNIYRK